MGSALLAALALFLGCDPSAAHSSPASGTAVAIDVGHSREDPGAMSASGVEEFVFNSRLAAELLSELLRLDLVGSVLLNPEGAEIVLAERAPLAEANGARLIVSIHHDSVQPRYLEERSVEGRTLYSSNRFRGFSLFYSQRNGRPTESLRLAELIGSEFLESGLRPSLHHAEPIPGEGRELVNPEKGIYRRDELAVLRGARRIPAVLVESGVIVHPEEEDLLATRAYRQKIVRAIGQAVLKFIAASDDD